MDSIAWVRGTRSATRALAVLNPLRGPTLLLVGLLTLLLLGLPGLGGGPRLDHDEAAAHAAAPSGPSGASGGVDTVPASARTAPLGVRGADEGEASPLTVQLTQLSPSALPARGAVTLTGSVANTSPIEWTDINVAPFVSRTPITTRSELAQAAETEESAAVGDRLTDPGVTVAAGDLQPGQSTTFSLRVPRSALPISGDPGVYWIGVHALGSSVDGRDLVADGRVRTFIPLVPNSVARRRSVPVSVVLPLRERARRAGDGRLAKPDRWDALTGPSGRLRRIADFGASAGSTPLTWLVDPAVLDALADYGAGNPPLRLGSTRDGDPDGDPDDGEDEPDPDDGETPSASPSPATSPAPGDGAPGEDTRARAEEVRQRLLASVRSAPVLALGYSDPDVIALARRGPALLRLAEDLSTTRLAAYGVTGSPVVAPPGGYVDPDLLPELGEGSLLLLTDREQLEDPPFSRLPTGQDLVLTDARALAGGPGPTSARRPLALRQRVLAETALEATKGSAPARPLVISLPARWNPGSTWPEADFFAGLQVPWVDVVPLSRGAGTAYDGTLVHGRSGQEIPAANVAATRRLVNTSTTLGDLLAEPTGVTGRLSGAALQASSYFARPTLRVAAEQVLALDATTRRRMDAVRVTGTDFVTLSGGSGTVTVTLVNGLGQPVTVGLRARADDPGVDVEIPEPVDMQPGERITLRLQVTSPVGVHEVTLAPVTTEGEVAGSPLSFSLRTSNVGRLIWYIISAGGVLLAVMIIRRIVLRIRLSRWRMEEP